MWRRDFSITARHVNQVEVESRLGIIWADYIDEVPDRLFVNDQRGKEE